MGGERMRDILLTAAIAAALIGGYIVMGKLDGFLARDPLAPRPSAGHPPLRIGFTDPLLAGSLPALPGGDVRLFSGTAETLLLRLSARELDLVFVPEDAAFPAALCRRAVRLRRCPLGVPGAEAAIVPLGIDASPQCAVWAKDAPPACRELVARLSENEKFPPLRQEDLH